MSGQIKKCRNVSKIAQNGDYVKMTSGCQIDQNFSLLQLLLLIAIKTLHYFYNNVI